MKELLKDYAQRAECELLKMMPESGCAQETVIKAMRYSVEAGGKRLRPVIMMMCAKMLGLPEKEVMPFACALEMVHTYSLIHDDLPAMDNDVLRRGKPTNHIVFGEAMAILAGDGLLNLAAETVSKAEYSLPAERVMKAVSELFAASGASGMIGGQVIDLESENKRISLDELKNLHLLKTGALIRAAARIPCVLAAATEEQLCAVSKYAENLGIAFQIRDDLLDVYGDSAELGKKVGSDAANNKSTYVTICGREKSEELMRAYTDAAIESLAPFGEKAAELKALAVYLTDRKN